MKSSTSVLGVLRSRGKVVHLGRLEYDSYRAGRDIGSLRGLSEEGVEEIQGEKVAEGIDLVVSAVVAWRSLILTPKCRSMPSSHRPNWFELMPDERIS
jgi:hypothetical protein